MAVSGPYNVNDCDDNILMLSVFRGHCEFNFEKNIFKKVCFVKNFYSFQQYVCSVGLKI